MSELPSNSLVVPKARRGEYRPRGDAKVGKILCALYDAVKEESRREGERSPINEGHNFESRISDVVFAKTKEMDFITYPPRYTLESSTASGNHYQFDASFLANGIFYGIECKRKKFSTNENLYYYNAKIMDYALSSGNKRIEGIFLSTSPLENAARLYAIAYGLTAIDPNWPPIDYLLEQSIDDSQMTRALADLQQRVLNICPSFSIEQSSGNPEKIFEEYRFLLSRVLRANE